jgi:hypothetical protein
MLCVSERTIVAVDGHSGGAKGGDHVGFKRSGRADTSIKLLLDSIPFHIHYYPQVLGRSS